MVFLQNVKCFQNEIDIDSINHENKRMPNNCECTIVLMK